MDTDSTPTAKTSFTGFISFLVTGSKLALVGDLFLLLVAFPVAVLYDTLTYFNRAFYPVENEPGTLTGLATRSWKRYKESLTK